MGGKCREEASGIGAVREKAWGEQGMRVREVHAGGVGRETGGGSKERERGERERGKVFPSPLRKLRPRGRKRKKKGRRREKREEGREEQ